MAGRRGRAVVLGLVALLYAAAALGNGIDRWRLTWPDLPGVPAFFAAQSWRVETTAVLTAGQADRAIAAGLRAVVAAPVEAGSSSLLGAAYLGAYRSADAERAFKVSARLGWRDVPTQVYWILAGLALSDNQLAADRLDALMRQAPGLKESNQVLVQLEASAAGRQALVARLAQGPAWLGAYAAGAGNLVPAAFAQRIALLRVAQTRGHAPSCQAASDAINHLAYQQSRFAEARELWDLSCMQGRAGLLADPDFLSPPRDPATPFDWSLPGAGGIYARIGDGVLYASNDNPVPTPVARQTVMLAPGLVRIEWRAEAAGAATSLAQAVKLYCPNRSDLAPGQGGAAQGSGSFAITVQVPPGCSPQELAVLVAREAGDVRIDAVNLRAAAPGI